MNLKLRGELSHAQREEPAKLARISRFHVSQILTVHRDVLTERIRTLSPALLKQVNESLRFALDL